MLLVVADPVDVILPLHVVMSSADPRHRQLGNLSDVLAAAKHLVANLTRQSSESAATSEAACLDRMTQVLSACGSGESKRLSFPQPCLIGRPNVQTATALHWTTTLQLSPAPGVGLEHGILNAADTHCRRFKASFRLQDKELRRCGKPATSRQNRLVELAAWLHVLVTHGEELG